MSDLSHAQVVDQLLAPITYETFVGEYWSKAPLYLRRTGNAVQSSLFATSDLDRILVETRPAYPELRIVNAKNGTAWDALSSGWLPGANSGGPEAMSALYDAYADGCSIVLNLEARCKAVDALCRSLQERFGRRCSSELYLTPRAAQTFPPHYDLHDVIIVQLDGSKTWKVYDPVVPNASISHAPDRIGCKVDASSERTFELTAGDLLYVPAGFAHEVLTTKTRSLHITLGLFNIRLHDALSEMVTLLAERHADYRMGVPLPGQDAGDLMSGLANAAHAMNDPALLETALDRIKTRMDGARPQVVVGTFDALDAMASLTPKTPLVRNDHMPCSIEAGMSGAYLSFGGERIEAPIYTLPALDFLSKATEPFSSVDLPGGLDNEARLVLLKRLIKFGLLTPIADAN